MNTNETNKWNFCSHDGQTEIDVTAGLDTLCCICHTVIR